MRLLIRLFLVVASLVFSIQGFGQDFKVMMEEAGHSLEEIQTAAKAHFDTVGTGRGTGYKQFKRWEYNARRMQNEDGMLISEREYLNEWYRWQAERLSTAEKRSTLGDFWEEHGPKSWNATSGWNPGIGRITSAAVDPEDQAHIIIGGQTGGVWQTFSRGEEWDPLLDDFSNMDVYSVAIHPKTPGTYYFGSGGGRLYKSVDFGATWTQIGSAGGSLVNRILIHPENPDTIFASSQRSGLYRSIDGGESWTKAIASDNRGYDFEFQPGNPETVYASGSGFHLSTDGGFTFTSIGTDEPKEENMDILSPAELEGEYISVENNFTSGYVPLPLEPEEFTSKVTLYTDEGDSTYLACSPPSNADEIQGGIVIMRRGSCTFVEKVTAAQNAGAFAVIVVNNEPGTINMAGEGEGIFIPAVMVNQELGESMIQSILDGDSLVVQFQQPLNQNFEDGPKMIGVSRADSLRVYVLEAESSTFGGFYRSLDGGKSFKELNQGSKNYFGYSTAGDDDRGQAPRDMGIAVNPFDEDEVHIAGINTWYSQNGGESFFPSSDWVPGNAFNKNIGYCHADVDDLFFEDSSLYVLTDGGIFVAPDSRRVNPDFYTDLSSGLGIRQFYKIGISQTDPALVSGGSQDNGTSLFTAEGEWIDWLGADGMETFIDKDDPDILYGTSQFGAPYFSVNGAQSYSGMNKPNGDGSGRWVTPFEQDPFSSDVVYIGYEQVFKTENFGQTWTAISQEFSAKLDHLKISPAQPGLMVAAHGGLLYKTQTGDGNWERIAGFTGNVNSVALHPTDPDKIAIATTSAQKVYISEDGGQSWIPQRLNLPNFAALALCWQDDGFDGLYLGMNYGVFFTDNTREEWVAFDANLPNVIINELEINKKEERIYAATYGRGLWSSPIVGATSSVDNPNESTSSFSVFPNPVRERLTIDAKNPHPEGSDFRMYTSSGQPVRYLNDIRSSQFQIDVNVLPAGLYYLQMINPDGQKVRKVIIK